MRGEVTFESTNPESAALTYMQLLVDRLRAAQPRKLEVDGQRVFVRGGIFRLVPNWNLLVGVTSATIDVIPADGRLIVRYEIDVTELLAFCAAATVASMVLAGLESWWFGMAVGPAMVWLWMCGGNYWITRAQMESLFRKVAKTVRDEEKQTGN